MTASKPANRYLKSLMVLGVVYGDIGTSPLYALRECFYGPHGTALTRDNILGVLSLIFWSLILVISVKYLVFVLRADNRGEGGILALMGLIHRNRLRRAVGGRNGFVLLLGLFGAALLYGDGVITPAISVLSAFEGLEIAAPALRPYVIPVTIVVLIGLFMIQRRGTAVVGALFGPVVLVWFVVLATLGLVQIVREPSVLAALNPVHGASFFLRNGWPGFLVLGAVFLVVTGGEALYADMGHFGAGPIRRGWFGVALPGLVLNYFGQGALLLQEPGAVVNPFYYLVPRWALPFLIAIATAATIIASQAVISGAYSLTQQAVQLGYSPRLRIVHTSAEQIGQIYIASINWSLMVSTIALVMGFRSSSNLAAAYGIAVTSTMVITTLLLFVAAREIWGWNLFATSALTAVFLAVDLAFLGANMVKIPDGGWFPLAIGSGVYLLMITWNRGRSVLRSRLQQSSIPLQKLLANLEADPPHPIPGTAVYMIGAPDTTPPALVQNLIHNKVLHRQVIFLNVHTEEIPYVPPEERTELKPISNGFCSLKIHYGFMESPNVPAVLRQIKVPGWEIRLAEVTYFMGRETILSTIRPSGMARWREKLFAFMSRNALPATAFFQIPSQQVFEVGAHVEI